ncbi:MAG: peptidase M15D vanX D-ala-D-ala dipeptidase [Calditrichaeota bacterium]|nr:MAG: peptidase M15D vanX D-ala-D-ala dipeptidase [Calditrichota bacterium]
MNTLKEKKIPFIETFENKKENYRAFPIDFVNQSFKENVFEVRDFGIKGENFYFRKDNPPYFQRIPNSIPDLLLRKTVIEKLQRVNQKLEKLGLELYVFDCYRPIEVQNYFYDFWFPNYLQKVNPKLSGKELEKEVAKYWAKGAKSSAEVDLKSPPPHSTGGAIDLTIRRKNGEHLFMGSIFDDVTEVSNTDFFEKKLSKTQLSFSDQEALQNRRFLFWLMEEEDFVNNPTEWWHFSYGDQMWAKISGKKSAIYSAVKF